MPVESAESPIGSAAASPKKPDAVKDLKFDYQAFLNLLKDPDARDVVTAIRKFIETFKSDYSVNLSVKEQVDKFRTYRDELAEKLYSHPVWIEAGEEAQLLGAEGIEYMTMNQIGSLALCPSKGDDQERDEGLTKNLWLFDWVELKHLDVDAKFALDEDSQQAIGDEFNRINAFRTPRDKLICLINGCRMIERSLTQRGLAFNADCFVPVLIVTLLKAKPQRLYSNLQYISRYRSEKYLASQTAYNFTNLLAAATFIEKLSREALVVGEDEFAEQMENAVARYNAELILEQEEQERLHREEMSRREAKMIESDKKAHNEAREQQRELRRSGSSEFKALLGDFEEKGMKLMTKVKQSDFMSKSKGFFSEFVTEAKTVVKQLVDEDDRSSEQDLRKREADEEEQFQMQLAMALSISEAEARKNGILLEDDKGKEKVENEQQSNQAHSSKLLS